ncbi:TadE/TadG family type IV pilus assembly protein [Aurantiacibacter hainanensis]|uniref:TadE/TadG family type IV pilus assembly protein n=1 Tax=Aurantiacibacter hainanensis TaxID=3076114 RepID=UPI0030C66821
MRMLGRLLPFLRDTRAVAAAEMALILPMAFALIFTTMEAGYYFQTQHKAIKYVREGARFASRQNFDFFDCSGAGAFDNSATGAATVQDRIRNVTLTGLVNGGNARIADWEAADINITVSCDAAYGTGLYSATDDVKAPKVLIWTRFDYTPILGLLGFDISNIDVVAQAEAPVGGI